MKTVFYILVATLGFSSPALADDFRTASWGMTEQEVRALEKTQSIESKAMPDGSNVLVIQDNVLGFPAMITYMFVDDKLVQGTTAFLKLSLDGTTNNAEANLSRIMDALQEKYGKPNSVGPSPIGAKKAQWQNESTDIVLTAGARDSKPFAMVLYYSRKLVGLRLKVRENEIEKKL